jgi:serine/threonine protein kinase
MIISENLTLHERIGRGGMGEVYRGTLILSDSIEKTVAVKLLRSELSESAQFKDKFKSEIKTLSQLQHPHIIPILAVGETPDQRPYLVMDYVEGKSLREIFVQHKNDYPLNDWFKQARSAIEYAHSKNILHGDISPQNIMATPDNQIYLLDFGISRTLRTEAETITSDNLGKPAYMSPSFLSGKNYTKNDDLYSLGIVFLELATKKRIVSDLNPLTAIAKIKEGIHFPLNEVKDSELRKSISNLLNENVEAIGKLNKYQKSKLIFAALSTLIAFGFIYNNISKTIKEDPSKALEKISYKFSSFIINNEIGKKYSITRTASSDMSSVFTNKKLFGGCTQIAHVSIDTLSPLLNEAGFKKLRAKIDGPESKTIDWIINRLLFWIIENNRLIEYCPNLFTISDIDYLSDIKSELTKYKNDLKNTDFELSKFLQYFKKSQKLNEFSKIISKRVSSIPDAEFKAVNGIFKSTSEGAKPYFAGGFLVRSGYFTKPNEKEMCALIGDIFFEAYYVSILERVSSVMPPPFILISPKSNARIEGIGPVFTVNGIKNEQDEFITQGICVYYRTLKELKYAHFIKPVAI